MVRVLIPEREAAEAIGMSERWLQAARLADDGSAPPHVKVGRRILYRIPDLEAWAAERSTATVDNGATGS